MESPQPDLNMQARVYFLQQGKSIGKLVDLLASNLLSHHLGKWLSLLIEIALYVLILLIVLLAMNIPLNIALSIPTDQSGSVDVAYNHEELFAFMLFLRFFVILLALPVFLFARLLARNRKKSQLIREAYLEAEKMKAEFNKAVKELKL